VGVRSHVHRVLHPVGGRLNGFSWFVIGLIALSIVLLALETEHTLSDDVRRVSHRVNVVIVWLFAIEYAARMWVAGLEPKYRGVRGHLRYAAELTHVADLLAFAPELIVLVFFPEVLEEAMFLRALRLIRVLRLLGLIPALRRMGKAARSVGPQLGAGLGLALMTVFLAACALYFAEARAQPEAFVSIPRAVWWAVATLTTVGYGDVYPITPLGRVAAGISALAGVGVVALPAGILAGAFAREFDRKSDNAGSERE
jgi:voltage-gated potassium channel